MNNGIVKFFNSTKGFGFIKEDGTNKEYFVHVSGLVDEIRENDEVTFELQEGKKGLNWFIALIRWLNPSNKLELGKISNQG